MTPDVNVLVGASRADHPHHAVAHRWLLQALGGAPTGATLTLMPMVLASFLRIVTSPRIFQQPTPIDDALRFVAALLGAPGVQLATIGPEWPHLERLCREQRLSGNDLPDAWLAAAVAFNGEHLVSFDRGFKRLIGRSGWTLLRPQPA